MVPGALTHALVVIGINNTPLNLYTAVAHRERITRLELRKFIMGGDHPSITFVETHGDLDPKVDVIPKQAVDTHIVRDILTLFANSRQADLYKAALDHSDLPPVKTFVVITNDADYIPILKRLRKMGCRIIVFHPPGLPSGKYKKFGCERCTLESALAKNAEWRGHWNPVRDNARANAVANALVTVAQAGISVDDNNDHAHTAIAIAI